MKYLGIDYGLQRTGIALSDEAGEYAFPKKVLATSRNLAREIGEYAAEMKAGAIVIGESKDYKGAPNPVMKQIAVVAEELKSLTGLAIHLEPEFMTSMQAERLQRDLGGRSVDSAGKRGEKDTKDMLDAVAAAFILQSFLDRQKK